MKSVIQQTVTNPELFSIEVLIRPLQSGVIPMAHGYHVNALLLNIIRASSPELSEKLHTDESVKPYTVSPLIGKITRNKAQLNIVQDSLLNLRFTFLESGVFSHFMDGALKWGGNPVEIAGIPFAIIKVETIPQKQLDISFQSYQSIIDNAESERQIDLEFLTPTAFRSKGKRNNIFPEPSLVFGSYLNRWQAFSQVKMTDGLTANFEKISVTRYYLETGIWDFGSYQEIGFFGNCRFEIDNNIPNEVVARINALADFARFCGTGAKTTMGMGQTRRKE